MNTDGISQRSTGALGGVMSIPPAVPPAAVAERTDADDLAVTIISPRRSLLDWRLKELWRYRDLVLLFVWRDFVAVYKQTILGPAWHLVRPLLTTLTFTLVFGRIAGLSTDGAPAFPFYMAGQVLWSYFATCLDAISRTFVTNAHLLGKVYFHRMVIPLSLVLSNGISFAIQIGLLLVVLLAYRGEGASFNPAWVASIPLLLVIVAGYALGGGLIICALTTRYRDLTHLVTFAVPLLMYVTPVIYPVSIVPEKYRWLIHLNPLTPAFEGFRRALLGVGLVTPSDVALSAAVMVAVVAGGLMLFTRVERTFMDTV